MKLDVVFVDRSTFIGYTLPKGVKFHDARDEYGESHECAAHGVDDDALGDEIHVLVADDLDGMHRLPVQSAREVVFRTGIIGIDMLKSLLALGTVAKTRGRFETFEAITTPGDLGRVTNLPKCV